MTEKMKTILLIDDSKEIRLLLKIRLEMSNFKTLQAENGQEGVELAKKYEPDLIITDYLMPELDGIQASKIIKSDSKTKNIPIIMLSSYPFGTHGIQQIYEIGIGSYMMKPYEFESLFETIYELLILKNDNITDDNDNSNDELRKFERFETYAYAVIEQNGKKINAKIKNISKNGLCIIIPSKINIGTNLKIEFPKQNIQQFGSAKVLWINQDKENDEYTAGLELEELTT